MKPAVIFAGGSIDKTIWENEQRNDWLVICADGGYCHVTELGIVPDMIIGDCDSCALSYPKDVPHSIYPSEKDETDTELCLNWAIEQGCKEVLILGGIGGRLDHEFANINLLLYGLKRGVKVRLRNEQNEIFMMDRSFSIAPQDKKYISFFAYGGNVEEFSVKGLKYELAPVTLTCDMVRTACNEFLQGKKGEISFKKGYLLVMLCQDKQ
jgi:thiamine pyrophosphokinase